MRTIKIYFKRAPFYNALIVQVTGGVAAACCNSSSEAIDCRLHRRPSCCSGPIQLYIASRRPRRSPLGALGEVRQVDTDLWSAMDNPRWDSELAHEPANQCEKLRMAGPLVGPSPHRCPS